MNKREIQLLQKEINQAEADLENMETLNQEKYKSLQDMSGLDYIQASAGLVFIENNNKEIRKIKRKLGKLYEKQE